VKKIILYLPERSGERPNACSFLRLISPLSALTRQEDYVVNELVSLQQLFRSDVIGLTTNRTAFLDFPGLSDMISSGVFPGINLHWDTDDYSGQIQEGENEFLYLQKLRKAQEIMETHASVLTASTEFIRNNSSNPQKWHVARNSIPLEGWKTSKLKDPSAFLFFGLPTHSVEIQRLSDSFDNIKRKRIKDSKISIEIVGNFDLKLNKVFRLTRVPEGLSYYPGFSRWLSNQSSQQTGLVLIENSTLNQGKSALKFLEYSAMGMSVAGYGHQALDSDSSSVSNYFQINRDNPAEDLINLISDSADLQRSATRNYQEVNQNRGTISDSQGMFSFFVNNYSKL
jgi:hypothetical protein